MLLCKKWIQTGYNLFIQSQQKRFMNQVMLYRYANYPKIQLKYAFTEKEEYLC